ncbi:MAG: ferritin-like domain-containing protein [Pseudomonadota bacterium]|uniref:ferritin-like domain-containing protein n=1 Tax=Phenylobacterium sp. TaxID=1871053 RepID=UPI0025E96363|nr:ferritin-like domain-containing protein [Phenylobacterium sp.]MBT9472024.1 ferritin-like domain-containing protein [Phenylobacterium sp.]
MTDQMRFIDRRAALALGTSTLSAAGVLAVLGVATPRRAFAAGAPTQDVQLLNAAIALEHEGIAAYQIAAESGLLTPDVLKIGITFQGHHKQHRDDLASAVRRLGGQPVAAKALSAYATDLGAGSLKDQTGVLKLALKLERGAANAYLGLIPSLDQTDFHVLAARMAGDEAFHAATLGNALGEAIPQKALIFG